MKTMFTTTPDKWCYEVSDGIWARPAHNSEMTKLRKQGWTEHEERLRKEETSKETDEETDEETEEVKTDLDLARIAYEQRFGKPPHHKLKLDTLRKRLEESDE